MSFVLLLFLIKLVQLFDFASSCFLFQMPIKSIIGNLHDPTVIARYEKLGLDDYFLTMLKHGVSFPIKDEAAMLRKCRRVANSSSLDNPDVVVQIIEDWTAQGFIEEVDKSEILVLHPLTLSERFIHEKQSLKPRLCLDLSNFNDFIETPYCKFPHLDYLGPKIKKDQFLALVDMKGTPFLSFSYQLFILF